MSAPMTREASVQAALYRDEVGIEFGVVEDFRVKTAQRQVYAKRDDQLVPVAFQADLKLQRRGHSVPVDTVLASGSPDFCGMVIMAWHRLAPRNHAGQNLETFGLQVVLRARRAPDWLDPASEALSCLTEAHAAGLEAGQVQFDLTDVYAGAPQRLAAVGLVARMAGARTVIDVSAAGLLMARGDGIFRPDTVRVGPRRFHAACREAGQSSRLRAAIAEFRAAGLSVQIDGIHSRRQFCKALALRADLYSGDYMAPARLAGADLDDEPRSLQGLLGEEGNVLRLFA